MSDIVKIPVYDATGPLAQESPRADAVRNFLRYTRQSVTAIVPGATSLLTYVSSPLASMYQHVVVSPLRRLYRNGPSLGGFGFWRSASDADVCAGLTKVDADFWRKNSEQCSVVIETDFMSTVVFVETLVYFVLLYYALRQAVRLLYALTCRSLRKRGLLERYSPRTLEWLHTTFPRTQQFYRHKRAAHIVPSNLTAATGENETAHDDNSPYSAYRHD